MFFANCKKCNDKIFYKRKSSAIRAQKRNIVCKDCKEKEKPKLERRCPSCNCKIKYKSHGSLKQAEKNKSLCPSCAKLNKQKKGYPVKCKKCDYIKFYKWEKTAKKLSDNFVCKKCKKEEEPEVWQRMCYKCNKVKVYKNKYLYRQSIKKYEKVLCRSCQAKGEYFSGKERDCPSCGNIIKYETSDACTLANKNNVSCRSCSIKSVVNNSDYRNKMIERGYWSDIFGKTKNEWSLIFDLPSTAIDSFLSESKESFTKEEFFNYCNEYSKKMTSIENMAAEAFNLEHFNKKINDSIPYRPDFKIKDGIYLNVDGLYWHSELKQEDKRYHLNIRKDFENLNMRIFQFRSDEVINKMPIIKSMIDNAKKSNSKKIGARKCVIKKVESSEAKSFFDKNHIKGYKKARTIGLYYKEDLVSALSYIEFKKKGYIKIDRFCSKIGFTIQGGFSKLLKVLESRYPDKEFHYWVDLRYGTGSFLKNLGFTIERETLGWEWTDSKNTYNRLRCRANMDERGLSEREYAKELGWYKIYDAGQRLFIKKNRFKKE